jgi:hypothetical protein
MANNAKLVPQDMASYIFDRKDDIKREINCTAIGTVESFDSSGQTVNVQINYLRTINGAVPVGAPSNDQATDKKVPYPVLVKCPLMILSGGSGYLTITPAVGDQCVVLFNDRDIDTWWTTGSPNSVPNSNRVHDLNDALVFIGARPQNNPIPFFNGSKLAFGSAFLTIDPSGNINLTGANITITGTSINLI